MAEDRISDQTSSSGLPSLFSDFSEMGSAVVSALRWAIQGNRVTSEKLQELIDTGFATLTDTVQNIRRRLIELEFECRDGELDRVVKHLRELGSFEEWDKQERQMRLCRAFREFRDLLHGVFSGGIDETKRDQLFAMVDRMIMTGEDRMADYLSSHLAELSSCGDDLQNGTLNLNDVRVRVAKHKNELNDLRLSLMKQEQEARDLLARS